MSRLFTIIILLCPFVESILDRNLYYPCSVDSDCAAAYTFCAYTKTCCCVPGFTPSTDGQCKPTRYNCPTWASTASIIPSRHCELDLNSQPGEETGSCKNVNEYCYVYPDTVTASGLLFGHCCPNPPEEAVDVNLICPLGSVVFPVKKSCSEESLTLDTIFYGQVPDDVQTSCPSTGYECTRKFGKENCCVKPCRGFQNVNVDGRCVFRKAFANATIIINDRYKYEYIG